MFIGIDLAWKAKARTGLAAVDESGRLVASDTVVTDDEIATWIDLLAGSPVTVAVDAPLIVSNLTGQRRGENEVARAFGRYGASPYPSNLSNPLFNPTRALVLANRFGWSTDPAEPGRVEKPSCIEVYPHPAMVGLFELTAVLPYKAGRGRTPEARRGTFLQLIEHMEGISVLRLRELGRWNELVRAVQGATRHMHLEGVEDEIDAVLCAHLAWLWHYKPEALRVYGTPADGYIVAPPPPPPPPPPLLRVVGREGVASGLERFVPGRPTGFAGGANEARWKDRIRIAFSGTRLADECRFAVECDFLLGAEQSGRNEPDLDNLIMSTIDALDEVIGVRRGTGARVEADDVRVDRISASKRMVRVGETPGARIAVHEL